jgi:hydrogenase nickel incorporation protein HypA/HybF
MHESAIALSILDIVAEKCREIGCASVDSITVRIGEAAGVMPESLVFAFDAFKDETVAQNARLIMEIVPLGGRCNACGEEFQVGEVKYVFACPLCGSKSFVITQGREMELSHMEIS